MPKSAFMKTTEAPGDGPGREGGRREEKRRRERAIIAD